MRAGRVGGPLLAGPSSAQTQADRRLRRAKVAVRRARVAAFEGEAEVVAEPDDAVDAALDEQPAAGRDAAAAGHADGRAGADGQHVADRLAFDAGRAEVFGIAADAVAAGPGRFQAPEARCRRRALLGANADVLIVRGNGVPSLSVLPSGVR